MGAILAVGIGAQQGADEQHGRAGGPHPAGKNGAHGQNAGVHAGTAHERARQAHAARHGKEREQQNDEGNVFAQNGMQHFIQGRAEAVDKGAGHEEGQTPENGDFPEMMLPEMRGRQRHDGDGQQHTGKGDDPDGGQFGPGDGGVIPPGGQRQRGQSQHHQQGKDH